MSDFAFLAALRAHAAQTGDAALQAQLQHLETELAKASGSVQWGNITAGNITGSTAVAIGSEIYQFVQQTTNLPAEVLTSLMEWAEAFKQRGVDTLDAGGQTLRVFLASPGDVKDERRLALKVIEKLRADPFCRNLRLEAVAWDKPDDTTPLLAGIDPQTAITQGLPKPSECDLFVAIFWSRLGTPLDSAKYRKPDGEPYRSGTEWELENALQAFQATGHPQVLVYRRTKKVLFDPDAPDFQERIQQRKAVQEFFAGFNNPDGSPRSGYNTYETPAQFGELLEQHLRKLLAQLIEKRRLAPRPTTPTVVPSAPPPPAWPTGKSPFPGLRAFGPEDAPVFFGRGAETDQLLSRLRDPACRFLAVVGASGSGKSSLVGAGLIPRLQAGALPGSERWPVMQLTPDEWGNGDPFDSLKDKVGEMVKLPKRELGERLRATPAGLRGLLEDHLAQAPEWQRAVLFIDQFEETFTRVAETLRPAFCAALDEAARSPRVLIIVTLRDDFYRYCVQSPVLSRLINRNQDSTYTLSAPAPLELHEMMTGPARVAGLEFEAGLVRQLLTDTGPEAGALALLAFALDQLYQAARGQGQLTAPAYRAFGGVQGAIGARAQATFDQLPTTVQATLARVFRELVEVDENGAATRKRALLTQVQADAACTQLAQALVQARLLVTSKGAGEEPLVEVAHEALFRSWPRLQAWIEEAQDDLILLRQVRAAAGVWDKQGRQPAYLWPDERLQPVYQMQARLRPELNAVEKEFIRLEYDRLLEELDNPATPHRRRSFIGERIDTLGDRRAGVGLVRADRRDLTSHETRLWGDQPEHIGLPDMVWVKVAGGKITIERQEFAVQPFYIAKYPVTYTQFQAFIDAADGFTQAGWWKDLAADDDHKRQSGEQNFKFGNHPRENVSWYDAMAFCRWLNARLSWPDIPAQLTVKTLDTYSGLRLLTEWEWQWAASPQGKEYPWGDEWDSAKANTNESGLGRTTAVGMYPTGAAPYGALDMSGNVREWCLNESGKPANIGLSGNATRVVRGGSWYYSLDNARAAFRSWNLPSRRLDRGGFRVCVRPPSLSHR